MVAAVSNGRRRYSRRYGNAAFAHDFGGSNGQLLDCLQSVLPHWAYVIAAFCVALMILFRPLYHWLKRR